MLSYLLIIYSTNIYCVSTVCLALLIPDDTVLKQSHKYMQNLKVQ
jgi:hypothetical protein